MIQQERTCIFGLSMNISVNWQTMTNADIEAEPYKNSDKSQDDCLSEVKPPLRSCPLQTHDCAAPVMLKLP